MNDDDWRPPIEGEWWHQCETLGRRATSHTYNKLGCRCQPCKDAFAQYRREGPSVKNLFPQCHWLEDRSTPIRTINNPYGEPR